jgi:hypothetical protein
LLERKEGKKRRRTFGADDGTEESLPARGLDDGGEGLVRVLAVQRLDPLFVFFLFFFFVFGVPGKAGNKVKIERREGLAKDKKKKGLDLVPKRSGLFSLRKLESFQRLPHPPPTSSPRSTLLQGRKPPSSRLLAVLASARQEKKKKRTLGPMRSGRLTRYTPAFSVSLSGVPWKLS